jgi:putative nucleotidyltransferase with HDIG domain
MIDRDEAITWLKKYLYDDKLLKHSYAVEVIMGNIADYLKRDAKFWKLVGLLHDLDYEYSKGNPEDHSKITAELLDGLLPEEGINAIKAHNYLYSKYIPATTIDKSLIAADAVSGLVIASALVMPSKKLNEVKVESLIKKFNDKTFAKGCDRKRITLCLDVGIDLEKFLEISLNALQSISDELNL